MLRACTVCVLNADGEIVLHRNIKTNPEVFLKTIAPYREDIVVGVECMFVRYWITDLCAHQSGGSIFTEYAPVSLIAWYIRAS